MRVDCYGALRRVFAALALAVFSLCGAWASATAGVEGVVAPQAPVGASAVAASAIQAALRPTQSAIPLPNANGSLKFAVLGDFGTGERRQYALAARMAAVHAAFPFELVITVGDNIYGSDRPQDYRRKFEVPYKPLLDAGVRFYGSLGNHDAREQRFYAFFNMGGQLYYTFKAPTQNVRFFALETTYMEPAQLTWLKNALSASREDWKLVFGHHPLYSSGLRHGSDLRLRRALEPLMTAAGVSVMFTGHDHIYERVHPQQGIAHFVTGSGGQLRRGNSRPNQPFSAMVVDDTNVFLVAEIDGDTLTFNAIATDGRVVDSGRIARRPQPASATTQGTPAR